MSTTKWLGLWHQERQGFYAGQIIKKADIPNRTRVVMRFNKYYKAGSNRPRFVFCFADSKGYESKCVPVEYDASTLEKLEKIDTLAEVMRAGNHNADEISLPSESQANAGELMQQAIELVEDITGEKWDFSYWTFE